MSKETMKQWLEALEDVGVLTTREWQAVHKNKANELRQAIAEAEKQEQKGNQLSCYCPNCEILGRELARIEKQEQGEPVAWRTFDGEGGYDYRSYEDNETYRDEYIASNGQKYSRWVEPLYTTPQQRTWIGLTDEEMSEAMNYWSDASRSAYGGAFAADGEYVDMVSTWRYIEAKLKQKNGIKE